MKKFALSVALLAAAACSTLKEYDANQRSGDLIPWTSNSQATANCKLITQLQGGNRQVVNNNAGAFVGDGKPSDLLIYQSGTNQPELYRCR